PRSCRPSTGRCRRRTARSPSGSHRACARCHRYRPAPRAGRRARPRCGAHGSACSRVQRNPGRPRWPARDLDGRRATGVTALSAGPRSGYGPRTRQTAWKRPSSAGRGHVQELGGVLPVFQTPFGDDGEVDRATLEREFDWLFTNGADGVVLAMVSEVLRLASDERDELATLTCRLARDRGACVISVGAESTKVAVRHARHARDAGAHAVMATP